MEAAAAEAGEVARQLSVLAERVRETAEAGVRGGRCREEDERPGQADVDPQQPLDPERDVGPERVDDTHERSALPGRPELRRPLGRREGRKRDERDQHSDDDDQADPGEQAPGQITARLPRLLRKVRHGLQARVREQGERQRERDLVPRRLRPERKTTAQRAR